MRIKLKALTVPGYDEKMLLPGLTYTRASYVARAYSGGDGFALYLRLWHWAVGAIFTWGHRR